MIEVMKNNGFWNDLLKALKANLKYNENLKQYFYIVNHTHYEDEIPIEWLYSDNTRFSDLSDELLEKIMEDFSDEEIENYEWEVDGEIWESDQVGEYIYDDLYEELLDLLIDDLIKEK